MTLKVPIISCSAFKHIYQLDSHGPLYNLTRDNGINIPVLQMRKLRVKEIKK